MKQIQVDGFGGMTQKKLSKATIAIVGCGGLGTWQAELLVRMGIGRLLIADDDRVTCDNLHRQILFTEEDAREGRCKVDAAAARLALINRDVRVEVLRERITRMNIVAFASQADVLLDATDHTPTRFLLNDFAIAREIPWIYTGVAGKEGVILPVLPPLGPCLRCLYPDPPQAEHTATCATAGILPMTVASAAALQVTLVVRILNKTAQAGTLIRLNVWEPQFRTIRLSRAPNCPCCGLRCHDLLQF